MRGLNAHPAFNSMLAQRAGLERQRYAQASSSTRVRVYCTAIDTRKVRDGSTQAGCALRQAGSPLAVSVVWPTRFAWYRMCAPSKTVTPVND